MERIKKILLSLLLLAFMGCSTVKRAGDTILLSSDNRVERIMVDSVIVRDSVFVKEKGDTVFYTKYRTFYKELLRVDSIVRRDTVFCDREVYVERSAATHSPLKCVVILLLCSLFLLLLWRTGLLSALWNLILKLCKLCIKVFHLKG
ncbi:MAG: hypothetical protein IIV04_03980 [Bacteroidaceae bacterium]|nr:hypothetical protein [Bacteroidaceae bacterium]